MHLLQLNRDVLDGILYELPAIDMLTCLRVNRYLNDILNGSARLKLKLQLERLGAESNPFFKISSFERLRLLNESTKNWSNLTPKYIFDVDIPSDLVNLRVMEGVIFGEKIELDNTAIAFRFLLPREQLKRSDRCWRVIDLGTQRPITYSLRWFELDLFAIVTSTLVVSGVNAAPEFTIGITLNTFSTGEVHPQANIRDLFVMISPVQRPHASLRICGRYLTLVIRIHAGAGDHPLNGSYVYLYNWKTTSLLVYLKSVVPMYEDAIFLSEEWILLPNPSHGRLDIYRIPQDSPYTSVNPRPCIGLQLPELRRSLKYMGILSYCKTNPISEESWAEIYRRYAKASTQSSEVHSFPPHKPYLLRGEDAVFLFRLAVCSYGAVRAQNVIRVEVTSFEQFMMTVHRKALVAIVQIHAPPPAGSVRRHWPIGDNTPTIYRVDPPLKVNPSISVSWTQWGPAVTRWSMCLATPPPVNNVFFPTAQAVGQRCINLPFVNRVEVGPGAPPQRAVPYQLLEFNAYICWETALRCLKPVRTTHNVHQRKEALLDIIGRVRAGELLAESVAAEGGLDELGGIFTSLVSQARNEGVNGRITPTHLVPRMFPAIEVSTELCADGWHRKTGYAPLACGMFLDPVENELPFLSMSSERTPAGLVDWKQVLMDEQCVVGVVIDEDGNRRLEVHYYG